MKKIIAIAALLASTFTASAYRSGQTKVFTSVNTIAMAGVITYDQLCLNGNNLETINPKKVCVEYKRVKRGGENETVCSKTEMQILSKPLDYVKTVCLRKNSDGDCTKSKKVNATHATSYTVTKTLKKWVGSTRDGRWNIGKVLSRTNFEVPACN